MTERADGMGAMTGERRGGMDDDEVARWLGESGDLVSRYSAAVGEHVGRMASVNADLRAELSRERRRTAAMRTALETIKRDYGQVCEEFTECQHPACFGSCGAWMTAEAALDADDASGRPGGEETERNTMAITKSPTSEYVERFAALMERQLAANRHKGDRPGWLGESFDSLKSRLCDEVAELVDEITCDGPSVDIAKEAADVANFCLFIADKAGGL